MRKQVYELSENIRVQALRGKKAAPGNRTLQKKKSFSLCVMCASDYPHRIVKLEELQFELLQKKLYHLMTPLDIYKGEFEVVPGCEEEFKELAKEHGFNASEVMSCE